MLRDKLRKWLGIEEPKDWSKEFNQSAATVTADVRRIVDEARKDFDFWQQTAKSFSEIPCASCYKMMYVYPFGGAYYTTHDGKKVHASCYDNYLKDNPGKELTEVKSDDSSSNSRA